MQVGGEDQAMGTDWEEVREKVQVGAQDQVTRTGKQSKERKADRVESQRPKGACFLCCGGRLPTLPSL